MSDFPPLPAADSVLVLAHLQNEFAHPDGKGDWIVHKFMKESGTFDRIRKVVDVCRSKGIPIIHIAETFRPGHPELRERRGGYVRGSARVLGLDKGGMAVRGTWGAEIMDEFKPDPNREEFVIDTAKVDPFTCSEFTALLENLGRRILLLGGLATNFGIEMTARSGNERDFGICVLSDCIDRFLGDYSEKTVTELLPIYGRVATSVEIIAELQPQQA
jgi:nicotinamidase-related amidase